MKGVIFIILNDMIEERYGIDTWERILGEVNPASEGIYVATESYQDNEMIRFVQVISKMLDLPSTEITKVFGRHLFDELNRRYSMFTQKSKDLFTFLNSIENVIHREVRKLYNDPSLPALGCHVVDDSELMLHYRSPRKLCYLAEGLISGAAEHYCEPIRITHETCMLDGAEQCELRIQREQRTKL